MINVLNRIELLKCYRLKSIDQRLVRSTVCIGKDKQMQEINQLSGWCKFYKGSTSEWLNVHKYILENRKHSPEVFKQPQSLEKYLSTV